MCYLIIIKGYPVKNIVFHRLLVFSHHSNTAGRFDSSVWKLGVPGREPREFWLREIVTFQFHIPSKSTIVDKGLLLILLFAELYSASSSSILSSSWLVRKDPKNQSPLVTTSDCSFFLAPHKSALWHLYGLLIAVFPVSQYMYTLCTTALKCVYMS